MNKSMQENQDLIKALRELDEKIKDSFIISVQAARASQKVARETFARIIEQQPELYGKGGKERNWLVREAEKFGLDDDWMASDEGPFNSPNE